tara:strand:+ start:3472 stop:3777 length:306 start_codon:yes stop_codon:yes gene_type:complete
MSWNTVKNVFLGGSFGVASGYCYDKYSKASGLGLGLGFIATQAKDQVKKKVLGMMDLDNDGDVDFDDLELAQEQWGITWIGGISYASGFGLGLGLSKLSLL